MNTTAKTAAITAAIALVILANILWGADAIGFRFEIIKSILG